MRLLVALVPLTLAVAVTAAVFALWPVVADAPWEDEIAPAVAEDRTDEIRCEGALSLRQAVIEAGITQRSSGSRTGGGPAIGGGILTQEEYDRQLEQAEREISRYC